MSGVRRPGTTRLNRRRLLGATAAGSAAFLAACGKRDTNKGAAVSSAAAQNPRSGGTLVTRLNNDLFNYDISGNGKSEPNPYAIAVAYDPLLRIQEGSNVPFGQNNLKSNLAESWEVSTDASSFTFHLRKGVKFADLPPACGRELTSADVKWSYEYHSRSGDFANNKKLPVPSFGSMLDGLQQVETPDPYTVIVRFKAPSAPFLSYSGIYALPILAHEIYDQDGNFSSHIVGSGPYQLDPKTSQKGARWVLKRNPGYWASGKPYVDEIDYLVLMDDASAYAAFQAKQLDILKEVADPVAVANIKRANPGAVAQDYVSPEPDGFYVSVRRPPFSDVRLRQAISLGMDRDQFVKVFTQGKGGWSIPAAFPGSWTQDEIKQILKFDPAQAKQLVSQAGYSNRLDVDLTLQAGTDPAEVELLQAQLKQVGININIKQVDKATGSKLLHSGDFTILPTPQTMKGDPDSRLFGSYHSTSPGNYIGLKDPKMDAFIEAERSEADPTMRVQRVKDASRYLAENYLSFAFSTKTGATFWYPYVKNYADNWQAWDWNAANIWLEK